MGGGRFDSVSYAASISSTAAEAAARGISVGDVRFGYSTMTKAQPRAEWKVNPLLDPRLIKGVRESRDSDEHPTTLPVAVFFDVTGSMRTIPQVFQEKMEKLMTELTVNGKIEHPHVLFGAIGDAYSDKVPFQVGQFESDNRGDEQLRSVLLEGGGGGSASESYELALYFAAYKTSMDCWDKRQKKGYLFTLGDERFYHNLPADVVKRVFGDDISTNLTMEQLHTAVTERFEYFHFHVVEGSYANDSRIITPWRDLLGQRFIMLDDSTKVCEAISGIVSVLEGADPSSVDSSVAKAISSIKPIRLIGT